MLLHMYVCVYYFFHYLDDVLGEESRPQDFSGLNVASFLAHLLLLLRDGDDQKNYKEIISLCTYIYN